MCSAKSPMATSLADAVRIEEAAARSRVFIRCLRPKPGGRRGKANSATPGASTRQHGGCSPCASRPEARLSFFDIQRRVRGSSPISASI